MARSATHIALLRGINVGGKHKLPMKLLAATFEAHGAREVKTYIQSGNVVFGASARAAKGLARGVSETLEAELGFAVPIVTRSAAQWSELVANNPFVDEASDPKQLHLALLDRKPSAAAVARLDPERSPGDRYVLRNDALYLFCPRGVARTKLTCAYFDRTLECVSTMRNWRTTQKLLALAF